MLNDVTSASVPGTPVVGTEGHSENWNLNGQSSEHSDVHSVEIRNLTNDSNLISSSNNLRTLVTRVCNMVVKAS